MANPLKECPLPRPVEKIIKAICKEQSQPPPEAHARRELLSLGEQESLKILEKIRQTKITKTFDGFIIYMARLSKASGDYAKGKKLGEFSPTPFQKWGDHHSSQGSNSLSSPGSGSSSSGDECNSRGRDGSVISFISDKLAMFRLNMTGYFKQPKLSKQFLALEELEFRRAFLVLSYIGGNKLEDVFSVRDVRKLVAESTKLKMGSFESLVWEKYGNRYCPDKKDRMKYRNWDSSGQHHFYHCHVHLDGSYAFKGPFLSMRTTLVHKVVKEENVLVVKFVDEGTRRSSINGGPRASFVALEKVAQDGIYIGKRRYRFFGIHFGDIHVLTAKYIEGLEEIVGNSKYGIFFPTRGSRSLADTMAGGDFDGDLYWVSQNDDLLKHFKQHAPWTCMKHSSSSSSSQKQPASFSDKELEHELFTCFLTARFQPSKTMGIASNSWLAHMDRMLTLGKEHAEERKSLEDKMLELVDIYYEALDAPKTGLEVTVPRNLIPDTYPHYMGMTKASYKSSSVLGEIYDQATEWELKRPSVPVSKLLALDIEVPHGNLKAWQHHYKTYLAEMTTALSVDEELKRERANKVIQKNKQILYQATELEKSPRAWEEIRFDALAIYHICYDYAMEKDIRKCGFAWKVAGPALMKIFTDGQVDDDRILPCSATFLREILTRKGLKGAQ